MSDPVRSATAIPPEPFTRSMWVLRSTDESRPYTLRLPPGANKTIGRAPQADFVVAAALVSRVHCQLTASLDSLAVEDLRSTNGTFVNEQRVTHAPLHAGDRLRLGQLELSVERT